MSWPVHPTFFLADALYFVPASLLLFQLLGLAQLVASHRYTRPSEAEPKAGAWRLPGLHGGWGRQVGEGGELLRWSVGRNCLAPSIASV